MKNIKRVLAGILIAVVFVTTINTLPMKAEAAETKVDGANGVIYVSDTDNKSYQAAWTNKVAPTRNDYVFGGWYKKTDTSWTAIKDSERDTTTFNANVYAKFVPAEVLSVRAQLDKDAERDKNNTEKAYLRLLSAVNGLDYQKVGFEIWYNKIYEEKDEDASNITKVFEKIKNSETDNQEISASAIFGEAATHFSVLRLEDIYQGNYEFVIHVTPTWTTLDGTTVRGQAKYLRVVDGFDGNHFISVPINFSSGSAVSAGQMELQYNTNLEVVHFDTGKQMKEGTYSDDKNGTIKIIANVDGTAEVKDVQPEDDIYANVWFRVKTDATTEAKWNFTMQNLSFCNWNEDWVKDLSAWNVTYYNYQTNGQ